MKLRGGKVAQYFTYIMASKSKTLYVGVTNNLERRVYQHKQKLVDGFTKKYRINKLVYYEATPNVLSAITREKQIKGWLRSKKIALIESMNPEWKDLSQEWYQNGDINSSLKSEGEVTRITPRNAQHA